ncbi:unnamed protein product [Schistosoma curassoni]|nr:unnamed protein product [Schistosoma curassoni]
MNQLEQDLRTKPICLIVLGMAGSGKTTFVKKLTEYLTVSSNSSYTINLDPAVYHIPYNPNIDIRDTVKFKEVMKQYGYGPNGAIMTSLNFFASQFHKVVDIINSNSGKVSYVIIDTPGQIEVFTWSASGTIITELLTDIIDCDFAIQWMRDFEAFQDALAGHQSTDGPSEMEGDNPCPGTSPYMNSLVHSMSLVLDEFYSTLRCCGISSITGEGMKKFVEEIDEAKEEYFKINLPSLYAKQEKNKQDSSDKSSKSHSSKHGSMLLDLAGNDDEAENDPLPDVDGIEIRPHSDSDDNDDDDEFLESKDLTSIQNKFQQSCSVDPVPSMNCEN